MARFMIACLNDGQIDGNRILSPESIARMKTPHEARELIEDGARQALSDLSVVAPYDPGRPCEIEVVFTTPDRLEEYRHRRGVEVTGPSTIVSRGDDWWQAWSAFYF